MTIKVSVSLNLEQSGTTVVTFEETDIERYGSIGALADHFKEDLARRLLEEAGPLSVEIWDLYWFDESVEAWREAES